MATPEPLLVAESVPQVAPEQPEPESVQFTPRPVVSLETVATTDCVLVAGTLTEVGETATATEVTVMVADADLVPSVTEVAVMVTVAGDGTATGAV
jgi:hypothetical protein